MTKKKILLINAKREKCDSVSPHLGLAMLAAVLKKGRHDVLVVDYQFKHRSPSPSVFIRKFKPDVIGLSLYAATMKETEKSVGLCFRSQEGGQRATRAQLPGCL